MLFKSCTSVLTRNPHVDWRVGKNGMSEDAAVIGTLTPHHRQGIGRCLRHKCIVSALSVGLSAASGRSRYDSWNKCRRIVLPACARHTWTAAALCQRPKTPAACCTSFRGVFLRDYLQRHCASVGLLRDRRIGHASCEEDPPSSAAGCEA